MPCLLRSAPLPQVATDTRLWLYGELQLVRSALLELIAAAADRAEAEADVLMPGFTHLQPAQTVRWSHWLLSHAAAWQRDAQRLQDLLPRVATLPLGSGAGPPGAACRPPAPACWTPAPDSNPSRGLCIFHACAGCRPPSGFGGRRPEASAA